MSRSNSSAVRLIRREEDSLALRKRILKSGQGASQELLSTLEASNEAYLERIEKLNKFKTQSKAISKAQNSKVDWLNEHTQLSGMSQKLESEVFQQMQALLATNATDNLVHGIITDMTDQHSNRQANYKEIFAQWKELKEILDQTVKSLSKLNSTQEPVDSNSVTTNESSNHWRSVLSLYADMLVSILSNHYRQWSELKEEESALMDQILYDRTQLFKALRVERKVDLADQTFQDFLAEIQSDDLDLQVFVDEWIQKIATLSNEHNQELEAINNEKASECLKLGVDPNDRTGGWNESDHDIFYKIYRRSHTEGMNRKTLTSLLRSQLPQHISQADITLHEEWYRLSKVIANKKKDAISSYESKRFQLIKQARESIESFKVKQLELKQKDLKLSEFNRFRQGLHDQLEEMRNQKYIQQIESELQALTDEETRRHLQEEETIRRDQEIKEKKRAIQEFHDRKRKEKERVEREELAKEEENRIKRLRDIEENKVKVEERNLKLSERNEERNRKEMEYQENEMKRIKKLMELATQVPYYDSIQSAVSKLDHITASVRGHEYIPFNPDGTDAPLRMQRGHIPMHGFTDKHIIRDARHRLASALRAAGVIHSDAARQAIASFHPKPHLAIHGIL